MLIENVVALGQRTMIHSDLFTVSWLLGRYCNYNCSYCWPHGRSDEKLYRPLKQLCDTMDEVKRQAREHEFNSFHFSFSGGEPTLYDNFGDLVSYYANDPEANYLSLHITTNLSRGLNWWKAEFIDRVKTLNRVSITASWHPEFAKDISSFIERIKYLQDAEIDVTVNIVMIPALFNDLAQQAAIFGNYGITCVMKPQSNETASALVLYTQEQLDIMNTDIQGERHPIRFLPKAGWNIDRITKPNQSLQVELLDNNGGQYFIDSAEKLNALGLNRFAGWSCCAGYRSLIIREPAGEVKRGYSCTDVPLGTIDGGFKIFNEPTMCTTRRCVSSADSKIPKTRIYY